MANRLNLMLHCGAAATSRQKVVDTPTPQGTDSWCPIPHKSLIDLMETRVDAYDMEIVEEAHGLTDDGARYFGMFQVQPKNIIIGGDGDDSQKLAEDYAIVFGMRNSHDKSFNAGLACGSGVFVCDNLCFSAEITVGRRHTTHINRDLPLLMSNAMGKLVNARVSQDRRLEAYKETELTNSEADHLVCEAFRAGAIQKTRIADVLEQWKTPAHPEFSDRTAWSLFNGFTEVYKNSNRKSKALSVTNMTQRTTRLHGVMDSACGLLTAEEEITAGVLDADAVTVHATAV